MTRLSDARDAGAFISSDLDDFGLDPYAFRVYARIVRRAGTREGCFESIDHISKACRIDRKRVYEALKVLLRHRLIEKESKLGKPNSYFLTPREQWIPLTCTENGTPPIPKTEHPLYRNRDTPCTENGTPPIPKTEHKGNPIKEIPLRESHQRQDAREDDGRTKDALVYAHARQIAREVAHLQRNLDGPKNFFIHSPWGNLANEMGLLPETVFHAFREFLEALGRISGKSDPPAWAGAVASNLFRQPGSEAACAPWLRFEAHYRQYRTAPDVNHWQDTRLGQDFQRFINVLED